MCNANDQIMSLVQSYIDTRNFIDELQQTLEGISDQIKQYMLDNDADEMQAGANIVTYKDVTSKRVDTTALKKLLGDALDPYFKVVTSKRFQVK